MWFVVIGVLLIVLKLGEIGPVANWAWWWVLAPFPLAAFWWFLADTLGWSRKKEMDKLEARKAERRKNALAALGIKRDPKADALLRAHRRAAEKVEGKRAKAREAHDEMVRNSVLDSRMPSEAEGERQDPTERRT